MKLDDIQAAIDQDSVIDKNALDREALKIPMLHAKYYRIFMDELRGLKGLESEYRRIKKDRSHYYLGKCDDQVYKDEPLDHKVLKADLDLYIDADHVLIPIRNQYELQKAKCEMLENFIKQIGNRSFQIKNAIDYMKFQAGQ